MLLSRNVDRVSDLLDMPTLLSSTVAATQTPSQTSAASSSTSYASALDLHAHIRRLNALYPQSALVNNISKEAAAEIDNLTSILITSLQSQNLKLAAAMRTIGWLRRVAPDLAEDGHTVVKPTHTSTKSLNLSASGTSGDGALGSLLLVCRLRSLNKTLEALEPLRDLADQETSRRKYGVNITKTKQPQQQQQQQQSALGTQTERYLKRYLEIYREQTFAIVSMYKSIFPSGLPTPALQNTPQEESTTTSDRQPEADSLHPLPSPLASFALHLADKLQDTLRTYLPNITDKSSRESLLTQVLYCASSMGRLGADFGMVIAVLAEDLAEEEEEGAAAAAAADDETAVEADPEWVQVMKKHRVQASRLEVLARGVGSGRKVSGDVGRSPSAASEMAAG